MVSFQQQTGKSIDYAFGEFHKNNPQVYERFKQLTMRLISKGRKRYSSKTIICVIRYMHDIRTTTSDDFKINDAYTSRYARLFCEEFPEHSDFFELRELRS
jgi:hypothetical protein